MEQNSTTKEDGVKVFMTPQRVIKSKKKFIISCIVSEELYQKLLFEVKSEKKMPKFASDSIAYYLQVIEDDREDMKERMRQKMANIKN